MEIKNMQNQAKWDGLVADSGLHTPFAQSWAWGEILAADGAQVDRLAVENQGQAVFLAQVAYFATPLGKYAFCPQGPVMSLNVESCKVIKSASELLGEYFRQKKCIFWRVEPIDKIWGSGSNIRRTIDTNPRATMILDLGKSTEELLVGMHQKTRYNINLAQKKNLEIKNEKNPDVLLKLMRQTGARDNFKLHHEKHYRNVLAGKSVCQLTAYDSGAPVATVVFVGFGDTFTYLYGASDYANRALMAPYLLQWQGIELGKKLGYKFYDFFGVTPRCHSERARQGDEESLSDSNRTEISHPTKGIRNDNYYAYDPNHQYAGVSRFKAGFGGNYLEKPGTFDLILNKNQYNLYRLLRWVRRKI